MPYVRTGREASDTCRQAVAATAAFAAIVVMGAPSTAGALVDADEMIATIGASDAMATLVVVTAGDEVTGVTDAVVTTGKAEAAQAAASRSSRSMISAQKPVNGRKSSSVS